MFYFSFCAKREYAQDHRTRISRPTIRNLYSSSIEPSQFAMNRKSVAVLILTVSLILTKSFSYEFFDDQARDYYDTLYQREIPRERVKSQRSNVVDFKMPGIHPEKVSLVLTKQERFSGPHLSPWVIIFADRCLWAFLWSSFKLVQWNNLSWSHKCPIHHYLFDSDLSMEQLKTCAISSSELRVGPVSDSQSYFCQLASYGQLIIFYKSCLVTLEGILLKHSKHVYLSKFLLITYMWNLWRSEQKLAIKCTAVEKTLVAIG